MLSVESHGAYDLVKPNGEDDSLMRVAGLQHTTIAVPEAQTIETNPWKIPKSVPSVEDMGGDVAVVVEAAKEEIDIVEVLRSEDILPFICLSV